MQHPDDSADAYRVDGMQSGGNDASHGRGGVSAPRDVLRRGLPDGPASRERRVWMATTTVLAATGGVVAVIPLARSLSPTEVAEEAAGPVTVDVGALAPGTMLTVRWRGLPVWVLRRTPEMMRAVLAAVPELADPQTAHPYSMPLPAYCANPYRSRVEHPDIVVLVGVCTHLGCTPSPRFSAGAQPHLPSDWPGGWRCPCHGSTFDLAGRVFKDKPAPQNLDIPRYMYATATQLQIGRDERGTA